MHRVIENALFVSLIWAAGILAQAIFFLGGHVGREWKKLMYCVFFSLFGLVPGRNESPYEPHFHVLMVFVGFTFVFAIFFREHILPMVSEHLVLVWNLLLLSIALPLLRESPVLLIALLIPSAATLVLALMPYKANAFWKAVFYVWFLFMVVCVGMTQWRLSILSAFLDEARPLRMTFADAFFSGMAFLSIGVYLVYLFFLIPIPGKRQSFRERMRVWHEEVQMMIACFRDDQLRLPTTVAIVLILGSALAANAYFHVLSELLLINVIIVLSPWLLSLERGDMRN